MAGLGKLISQTFFSKWEMKTIERDHDALNYTIRKDEKKWNQNEKSIVIVKNDYN